MKRLATALVLAAAAALIATAVFGQAPRTEGRFQRQADGLAVPAAAEAAPGDFAALLSRLDALEENVAALVAGLAQPDAAIAELAERLAAIEAGLDTLLAAAAEPPAPAIAPLELRLDELAAGQEALADRIAALEGIAAEAAAAERANDGERLLAELAAIREDQASLAAAIAELTAMAPLVAGALAEILAQLDPPAEDPAVAAEARIAELERRIAELEQAQTATEEALAALPPPIDFTAIEQELAALGERYGAMAARNAEMEEQIIAILDAQQALLDELRRMTETQDGAGTEPPSEATALPEPAATADPGVAQRFGDELVLRLYGWVADLKRGLTGG